MAQQPAIQKIPPPAEVAQELAAALAQVKHLRSLFRVSRRVHAADLAAHNQTSQPELLHIASAEAGRD